MSNTFDKEKQKEEIQQIVDKFATDEQKADEKFINFVSELMDSDKDEIHRIGIDIGTEEKLQDNQFLEEAFDKANEEVQAIDPPGRIWLFYLVYQDTNGVRQTKDFNVIFDEVQ